jgi:methylenetetrahydrofolate reductase (NADPH)
MSRFGLAIVNQEFLITAEVSPPKGSDPSTMLERAKGLVGRVHAVNLTDSSRAILGMSPVVSAYLVQQYTGMETICQLACRDRNRIALQGDLLGAYSLGIRNILALTGDPVSAGDQPQSRAVFDYEAVRLLQLIDKLNQGLDGAGQPLPHGGTNFWAGAAVDPQSPSWSGLKARVNRKVSAGAKFLQSQMITDFERLDKFMGTIARPLGVKVLAGIFLLKSAKNAQFINKYVPGVQIPDSLIDRLAKAKSPLDEGISIAAEQVQIAQQICDGVHLMAIKSEHLIPEILNRAGLGTIHYA